MVRSSMKEALSLQSVGAVGRAGGGVLVVAGLGEAVAADGADGCDESKIGGRVGVASGAGAEQAPATSRRMHNAEYLSTAGIIALR
jgi:hypothetical protein